MDKWQKTLKDISTEKNLTVTQEETLNAKYQNYELMIGDRVLVEKLRIEPEALTQRLRALYSRIGIEGDLKGKAEKLLVKLQERHDRDELTDLKSEILVSQATELRIVIHGCSIEQFGKNFVWEQVQSLVPNHVVEVISIARGSVIITIRSSAEGINELYAQYQNGTLNQILGFPIESLKTLNNQASKSLEEEDKFSREIFEIIRDAGNSFIKLPDIKNIVKESFTISSQGIIDRILTSLESQPARLDLLTRSNSNNISNEHSDINSNNSASRELANQIAARILYFRSN